MPFETCKKCGKVIDIPVGDFDNKLDKTFGECPLCYTVIASERYPKTPGKITVFSSRGRSLGDMIFSEVINQYYKKINPEETIIDEITNPSLGEIKQKYGDKFGKYFVSDVRIPGGSDFKDSGVFRFKLNNEVIALSEMGYYSQNRIPQIPIRQELFAKIKPQNYILVHPRNKESKTERNMNPIMMNYILNIIENNGLVPVIVGTNPRLLGEIHSRGTIDLRGQTTLENLCFFIVNAFGMVGPDSGPIHLAAVNYTPFVSWNYENSGRWIPRNIGYGKAFLNKDSKSKDVYQAIQQMINWKKERLNQIRGLQIIGRN